MKRKWLLTGGAVLAGLLLGLCFFGVRVRLAPRWMVSRVLTASLAELEARYEKSPVHLLTGVMDPEGRQQADLQLETQIEHLGIVRYDMSVQTQLSPCRILSQGTVVTGGRAIDLELYMDENFAAVSSQGLVNGNFYGITYDSFSRDIRSRELLAVLIGEEIISQWEASVSKLEEAMSVDLSIPELTCADVVTALHGSLALKPQVDTVEQTFGGRTEKLYSVTFRASGPDIAEAAGPYLDQLDQGLRGLIGELSAAEVVFFLHKEGLAGVTLCLEMPDQSTRLTFSPSGDTLAVDLENQAGEELNRVSLLVTTVYTADSYEETVQLIRTENGVQKQTDLAYVWDLSSGEMQLNVSDHEKNAQLRLNLAGEGDGLSVTTQDISPLINLFLDKPWNGPAICTLRLTPGSTFPVPEYRNLDQWSVEDLFSLLTGLGGLLGLKMP